MVGHLQATVSRMMVGSVSRGTSWPLLAMGYHHRPSLALQCTFFFCFWWGSALCLFFLGWVFSRDGYFYHSAVALFWLTVVSPFRCFSFFFPFFSLLLGFCFCFYSCFQELYGQVGVFLAFTFIFFHSFLSFVVFCPFSCLFLLAQVCFVSGRF